MNNNFKFIIIGFIVFLLGIIVYNVEIKDFEKREGLTSNFNMESLVLNYDINKNKVYRFTNDGTNKNLKLYINNNLTDEIKVIVSYVDYSRVQYDFDTLSLNDKQVSVIDFETDKDLYFHDLKNLVGLGFVSFREKVIYNYSLLEYPEIQIFVNEKYRENIEFVGQYGEVYNPIR